MQRLIPGAADVLQHFRGVTAAACRDGEADARLADVNVDGVTHVLDADYVCPAVPDNGEQLRQRAIAAGGGS